MLDHLYSWCGTTGPVAGGGLLLGLFIAGAAGSGMHCVPMCGGFVLGQMADRMAALPAERMCEWRRFSAGALLPYHAGRLTTYAGLGALAGLGGAALAVLPWFELATAALLLAAAALFLLHALRRMLPALARRLPRLNRASAGWNRIVARLAASTRHRPSGGGYLLGVVLGFLPCGFLYAALAVAAASGGPAAGALAMLSFGLGTAPALVLLGVAGQAAGRRWEHGVAVVAPGLLLLNAALLTALAVQRIMAVV